MRTGSQIGYLRDMIRCQPIFENNFERTGVCTASSESTFEEGPTKWGVPSKYYKKCPRSTTKNALEVQQKMHMVAALKVQYLLLSFTKKIRYTPVHLIPMMKNSLRRSPDMGSLFFIEYQ